MKFIEKLAVSLLFITIILTGISSVYYNKNIKEYKKATFTTSSYNKRIKVFESQLDKSIDLLQRNKISKKSFLIQVESIKRQIDAINLKIKVENNNIDKFELLSIKRQINVLSAYIKDLEKNIDNIKASSILNSEMLYEKTLYPSVRIVIYTKLIKYSEDKDGKKTENIYIRKYSTGSGTIVYSKLNEKKDGIDNYIITCSHLIDDINLIGNTSVNHINIHVFNYLGSSIIKKATIVANTHSRQGKDIMVLKIKDDKNFYKTATFISKDKIKGLKIFDPILNVGAGSGRRCYPSLGYLTGIYNETDGLTFLWQSSAPGVRGNSGGGIFMQDNGEMIGILVRGGVSGFSIIAHQSFFVDPKTIYDWLEMEKLDFILTK